MKKNLFIALLFLFPLFISSGEVNTVTQKEKKVLICTGTYATKYHAKKCRGLSNCKGEIITITLEQAKNDGYTPCGNCYKNIN